MLDKKVLETILELLPFFVVEFDFSKKDIRFDFLEEKGERKLVQVSNRLKKMIEDYITIHRLESYDICFEEKLEDSWVISSPKLYRIKDIFERECLRLQNEKETRIRGTKVLITNELGKLIGKFTGKGVNIRWHTFYEKKLYHAVICVNGKNGTMGTYSNDNPEVLIETMRTIVPVVLPAMIADAKKRKSQLRKNIVAQRKK